MALKSSLNREKTSVSASESQIETFSRRIKESKFQSPKLTNMDIGTKAKLCLSLKSDLDYHFMCRV